MNQANLDQLLQVSAPRRDWGPPNPPSVRDDRPVFDDHLALASSPRHAADSTKPAPTPPAAISQPVAAKPHRADDQVTNDDVNQHTTSTGDQPPVDQAASHVEKTDSDVAEPAVAPDAESQDAAQSEADHQSSPEEDGEQEPWSASALESVESTNIAAAVPQSLIELATNAGDEAALDDRATSPAVETTNRPASDGRTFEDDSSLSIRHAGPTDRDDFVKAHTTATEIHSAASAATEHQAATKQATALPAPEAARVAHNSSKQGAKPNHQRAAVEPSRETSGNVPVERPIDPEVSEDTAQETDPNTRPEKSANRAARSFDDSRDEVGARPAIESRVARAGMPIVQDLLIAATSASSAAEVATAGNSTNPDSTEEPVRAAAPTSHRTDALPPPIDHVQHGRTGTLRGRGRDASADTPQVDPARFVGRVAKAFHTAQERGGVLQLRLSPPELGALRLELVVHDGVLAATLETDSHVARRVLLDHLPALRDRLAEQNIRVERFDVDVRQEGGGHSPSGSHHQRQNHPHHGPQNSNSSPTPTPPTEPSGTSPGAVGVLGDTQINLVA